MIQYKHIRQYIIYNIVYNVLKHIQYIKDIRYMIYEMYNTIYVYIYIIYDI